MVLAHFQHDLFNMARAPVEEVAQMSGVSPAILTRLLQSSIFLNLKDLGIELPPYDAEVVELEMGESQGQ